MQLIFKNDHDIKRFYHFFWFYQIIFYFTKLDATYKNCSLKEECQGIITAYNLKNKAKRLKYIYEKVCSNLDDLAKQNNYCDFKCNKCLVQRNREAFNGCCGNCKYLGSNGCTIKSLTCKLYYCFKIRKIKKCPHLLSFKLLRYYLTPVQMYKLSFCFFETEDDTLKIISNHELIAFLLTYRTKDNNKRS